MPFYAFLMFACAAPAPEPAAAPAPAPVQPHSVHEVPADFPEDVPLYPDATDLLVATLSDPDLAGYMLMMETTDAPAEALARYKAEVSTEAFPERIQTPAINGLSGVSFYSADRGRKLLFSVSADPAEPARTRITLTIRAGAAGHFQ